MIANVEVTTEQTISLEEYLSMSFPDSHTEPEFVRDHLEEKAIPDTFHSEVQATAILLVREASDRSGRRAITRPELRARIGSIAVRVPDLMVYLDAPPPRGPRLVTSPPLAIIEITSPEDLLEKMLARLGDYMAWGAPYVFLVEPRFRQLYRYTPKGLQPVDAIELPEFGFRASIDDLLPAENV